ncbi:hypothetical protein GCM10009120_51290 [Sphingobacterium siyangense subsp. cladoniae]|uniref:MauE/DoxX family redox-associated membrane protein n=1 Tax=Sphingobacterium siyangense TaxID=459529 RepID=UPI0031F94090
MVWKLTQQGFSGKKGIALLLIILSLLALWIPVTIDKLTDFTVFKKGILNQPFSDGLGYVLIYALPVLECGAVICLISEKLRGTGLVLSTLLMVAFTGYVGMALLGAWEKLPCGCGSVISGMTWLQHFFFNVFFLLLSITGHYLWYKLRGSNAGSETAEGGSAKRLYNKSIL